MRAQRKVMLASVGWGATLVVCLSLLIHSSQQSGKVAEPPSRIPEVIMLGGVLGSGCLVVSLHPHCPCSSATIENLQMALASVRADCDVVLLVSNYSGQPSGWADSNLVDRASRIKRCRVVTDLDNTISKQLGMLTSGHVLFYDHAGDLKFSGGVTSARGHEGACSQLARMVETIENHAVPVGHAERVARTPVFGCPLASAIEGPECQHTGSSP